MGSGQVPWNYEDIDPDWTKPPERDWLRIALAAIFALWLANWFAMTALSEQDEGRIRCETSPPNEAG